ncbi:ABC transporter permease [Agromyces ramosus]|uniref:ABC transporter permease n=1 Tax=Agromyces ramosus TaxID=33879 RepID=UPI003593B576
MLLSLIGVAVAVLALTTVVAAGAVTEQVSREANERSAGRPATLTVYIGAAYDPQTGMPASDAPAVSATDAAWAEAMQRYGIEYHSRVLNQPMRVQFTDGVVDANARAVDVAFGEMHRVALVEGAWFVDGDRDRFAPALVVNEAFWDRLGRPPVAANPVIEIVADRPVTGVIIGVTPRQSEYDAPEATLLIESLPSVATTESDVIGGPQGAQYEAWVPESEADALTAALQSDLRSAIGEDAEISVNRNDWGAWPFDPFLALKLLVGGVAGVILLLGALGLVNIALVTVRTRIREIGIRRSFGATSGRIFFAVLMESVVATFLAGAVGVGISIALVRSPLLQLAFGTALDDAPAFPIDAAIIGLVAATAVGAIAGLLPAVAAVRVRVIDAIRF